MLLAEQSVSWSFCSGLCRCESVSSSNLSRGRTFCNDTSVKRYLVAVFILPCSCCRVIACAKYSAVVPSFFRPFLSRRLSSVMSASKISSRFRRLWYFCKQAVDAVLDFLRLLILNDDTAVLGIPSRRNDCCSGADTANFRASGKSQMDGSSSVFVCLILATNNVNGDIHSFYVIFAARVFYFAVYPSDSGKKNAGEKPLRIMPFLPYMHEKSGCLVLATADLRAVDED